MSTLNWHREDARELLRQLALKQQWDALNAIGLNLPFQCADAMDAALEAFGSGKEKLVLATSAGTTVFMAVLVPLGRLRWATFQPSQLPLGAWVASRDCCLQDLARSLTASGTPGLCLAASITQIDPLQAPRQADAADSRHDDYVPTAWLTVAGSFDDFWAARGKNLRQNMRKQRNKLAADGITAGLKTWRQPQDVSHAIMRYGAMESGGWKAGQGTAIHPGNAQGRFYTRLFTDAAQRGEMLLTEYEFNGKPVAMNLGLLRAGTWVVLKTTYDESVGKSLSPSSLLREDELQAIFSGSLEVRRIEYYGRVMDWHTKLTDQQRGLYQLTNYRWPWVKRLAERRHQTAAAPPVTPTAAANESAE